MRYLSILAIWAAYYCATPYFGGWYDQHFHLYQSLVSLILMVSVSLLTDEWWKAEYLTLCALQILHNIGDYVFDFPAQNYSIIQGVLNLLEIMLILLAGGLTQLYRMTYGRDAAAVRADRGRDDAQKCASSGWRDA